MQVQSGRHVFHDTALSGLVTARQQLLKKTP
jgi:hypothetical protein